MKKVCAGSFLIGCRGYVEGSSCAKGVVGWSGHGGGMSRGWTSCAHCCSSDEKLLCAQVRQAEGLADKLKLGQQVGTRWAHQVSVWAGCSGGRLCSAELTPPPLPGCADITRGDAKGFQAPHLELGGHELGKGGPGVEFIVGEFLSGGWGVLTF